MKTREVVLFIHGISPDEDLGTVNKLNESGDHALVHNLDRKSKVSHQPEYKALAEGIGRYIGSTDKKSSWDSAVCCYAEWGWEYQETDASNVGASHRLIDAQLNISSRVVAKAKKSFFGGLSIHPIRKTELMGISDVFYYLSQDGNHSIKSRLYHQIATQLEELLDDTETQISLTVIGHSAGSVISLDLVTFLMNEGDDGLEEIEKQLEAAEKEYQGLWSTNDNFINSAFTKGQAVESDSIGFQIKMIKLKRAIASNRIKLRRLITMGSPIAMMILRSDQHVRSWAYEDGDLRSCESLGLPRKVDPEGKPYWVNIWDKYDPISFPVEPIAESDGSVKDFQRRVGLLPFACHTKYWYSRKVHKLIAEMW